MARPQSERARAARWRGAAELLGLVRREPGITRAAAAQRLRLSTGSATEITARLRDLCLLTETPAPISGRGRPTSLLRPHPQGPVVVAIELRHEDWRCAVATLDAEPQLLEGGRHESRDLGTVLTTLHEAVVRARQRFGQRVRAISVAVAGTVSDGHLVQSATLGWEWADLTGISADPDLPLLVGNDATLAGVAEARTGRAAAAHTALHLLVAVGIGGAVIVAGQPVTGATGTGGEYGHVPFGDPSLRCPCGARGCWDLEADGRALARHLGDAPPEDPRTYTRRVLAREDPAAQEAVRKVVSAIGRGVAGLVNAHDPDLVTLGGLAVPLRAAAREAFDTAYTDGLMHFRRLRPPPVLDALHGDDGPLYGAIAVGLDHITTESALAAWAELPDKPPPGT